MNNPREAKFTGITGLYFAVLALSAGGFDNRHNFGQVYAEFS